MIQHFMPAGAGAAPAPAQPGPGAPPPPAAADPHANAASGMAEQVDPNNPIQVELITRASKLTQADQDAFVQGCSPEAAAVLKKMLPEIGFLLDHVMAGRAPAGAGPSAGAPMPPAAGQMPPMAAPAVPRPSVLSRFG